MLGYIAYKELSPSASTLLMQTEGPISVLMACIWAKEKINLRDELRAHKFEFDLLQNIPCTKQENKEYQKFLMMYIRHFHLLYIRHRDFLEHHIALERQR